MESGPADSGGQGGTAGTSWGRRTCRKQEPQRGAGMPEPGAGPQASQWYSPLMRPEPRRRTRWPWAVGAVAAVCAVDRRGRGPFAGPQPSRGVGRGDDEPGHAQRDIHADRGGTAALPVADRRLPDRGQHGAEHQRPVAETEAGRAVRPAAYRGSVLTRTTTSGRGAARSRAAARSARRATRRATTRSVPTSESRIRSPYTPGPTSSLTPRPGRRATGHCTVWPITPRPGRRRGRP